MSSIDDQCIVSLPEGGPVMMRGRNPNRMYPTLLEYLLKNGDEVEVRGHKTRELRPVTLQIERPYERVIAMPGRKLNPFFLMAEVLWLLSGRADAEFITYYNSNLKNSLDPPGDYFHAPYGERIRNWNTSSRLGAACVSTKNNIGATIGGVDQISACVQRLAEDPYTRQAVIVLWNSAFDYGCETRDYPCNNLIYFKFRDGKLHMTVINRSNDINWGLMSTNVVQFSMIHELIAHCVGFSMGTYTHFTDSLHAYEETSYEELAGKEPFPLYEEAHSLGLPRTPYSMNWVSALKRLEKFDDFLAATMKQLAVFRSDAQRGDIAAELDQGYHIDEIREKDYPLLHTFAHLLAAYICAKEERYDMVEHFYSQATFCDWKVAAGRALYRMLVKRTGVAPDFTYEDKEFGAVATNYVMGEDWHGLG